MRLKPCMAVAYDIFAELYCGFIRLRLTNI